MEVCYTLAVRKDNAWKEGKQMNTTIKAVFFDVDATIYSHRIHDVLPSTKIAFNRLKNKGIKVGIATSRCQYEMKNTPSFLREYPFAGMIYDGGALVMENDSIISAKYIRHDDVRKIINYGKEHQLSVRYSTFDKDYFAFEPKQEDKDIFFQLYLNTPIVKAYEDDDVLNCLIYVETKKQHEEIVTMLEGISIVDHQRVLEINAGMIDKSDGVKALAKHWNLSMEEIMCFGDGANDVFFLQEAGIGVAMGNGCDAVKEVADFVTDSIEEDGVFIALRKFGVI